MQDKLKYLGLNLNAVPNFIKEYVALEYFPPRYYDEKGHRVYRYIDVRDIQIMLTPTNRLNTIKEKYLQASSLYTYLNPENEEDILKHTTFLKMLRDMQTGEVEAVAKKQQELNGQVPFRVKFEDNYLWQIYYSENTKKYFMLVTTEDLEYSTFFYLLKKQIECHKSKKEYKIFVPISYVEYSGKYLKKSEFSDIEKYLWVFTKEWPSIYEVYDKEDNLSVQIVGTTNVYEKVQSHYKIKLDSKEKANEFYKLLKALFILQTELPQHYKFSTQIGEDGQLQFEFNNTILRYDDLTTILRKEAVKHIEDANNLQEESIALSKKLRKLEKIIAMQEAEYLQKEKQIAMYLECRKTFFGRVKYFFKAKKRKKNEKVGDKNSGDAEEKSTQQIQKNNILEQKENYTIEDLVKICKELDKILSQVKNIKLDISASENKTENMKLKINNATLYIEEIDSHEKSIFEFWKFANKDESLMLTQGNQQENIASKKISRVFDYEEDFEELGIQVDKIQRKIFTRRRKRSNIYFEYKSKRCN